MIEAIEACVKEMLERVSSAEHATNVRLRRKTQDLLRQLGELRNDLEDEQRGIDEKKGKRKTR